MKPIFINLFLYIFFGHLPLLSKCQSIVEGKVNFTIGTSYTVYLSNLDDLGYSSKAFDLCIIQPDGNFKCNIAMDSDTFRIVRFRISSSGPNYYNQDGFHDNTILLPIHRNSTLSLKADADSLFYSVFFPNDTKLNHLFSNLRSIKNDLKEWSISALETLKKTKDKEKGALIQRYQDTVRIFSNSQKAENARLIDEENSMYNIVYAVQEYFIATGNSYHDAFLEKVMEKLDNHLPLVINYKQKSAESTYSNTRIGNIMDSAVFLSLGSHKNWRRYLKNKDAVVIF